MLRRRLDDLEAAASLVVMRSLPGACHELKADRAGELAIRLSGGHRLAFVPAHELRPTKLDGGLDWNRVTRIRVIWIGDYHD